MNTTCKKQFLKIYFTFRINKKLPKGSEAPIAYKGKKEFPEYYRPYLLNYQGHGYLIVMFSFFVYCKKIKINLFIKSFLIKIIF